MSNVKMRNIKGMLHSILFAVFKQSEPILEYGFISDTPSTMYCHCAVYAFPASCRAREGKQPGPSVHTKSNAANEAESDEQE
jgi:hypothetical protein